MLKLNNLRPAKGSKPNKTRVGRGIGSGIGKTCGRGHKGQHSRAGSSIIAGFEGGQMPLHRRLPKFGFTSRKKLVTAEVRLQSLNHMEVDIIDLQALKEANIIPASIKHVKIFASGKLKKAVVLKGLSVSKGARAVIEAAGGKIEA